MKQTPSHDLFNDSIFNLLEEIQPKLVVEVGCMRGHLAQAYLKTDPSCIWHGIDIDEGNIAHAKDICTHAHLVNIEKMTDLELMHFNDADTWIFGDVLEHLYNPWKLLEKIKSNATRHTNVIACIPNSQHWSVQARINSGMMQYDDDGFFDRTHIRFFSRITIAEMFVNAGFTIEKMFARNILFEGAENFIPHIRAMSQASGLDPEQAESDAIAFQYVIQANVSPG